MVSIHCNTLSEQEKSYILEHFKYLDGVIARNDRKGSSGSYDKDGYLILKIKGKQYKAHRIVWLLVNGEYPACEIDHIDRDRKNNRIENLRLSNRRQQVQNSTRQPNPDTGVVGIYLDKCTKGLKKRYTFKKNGKTYRAYTLEQALEEKYEQQSFEDTRRTESAERAFQ